MNSRSLVLLVALALGGPASASPGDPIAQIGSPGTGAGQLDAPWGAAVDGSGNVYVTDTANARIQVFSREGAFLRSWGSLGAAGGQLDGPTGIAVCDSSVYVADTNNDRVQHFDTAGNLIAVYGGLSAPHGLACEWPFLYVADTGNHRIVVWEFEDMGMGPRGVPNGGQGSGPDQYDSPTDIALGVDGAVYIADRGNDRIVAVNGGVTHFGTTGVGEGQLSGPTGVEVDAGGNVYVVDSGNARVQVFTPSGAVAAAFGTPGTAVGQLASPSGVAFDQGGARVIVADSGNDRLQAFQALGADLAVTAIVAPPAVGTLEQLSFTATVRNLGPGTPGYSYVYAYLSTDAVVSSNDVLLCSWGLPSLAPGAEQSVMKSCAVPADIVSGPSYLLVKTMSLYGVLDPDSTNSTGAVAIQVNGPDLAVASVSAPFSAGTLQAMTVSATVVNQGLGSAKASTLSFSLVTSTTGAVAATLGNVAIGALAPGGQQTVTATYTLTSNLTQGSHVVRATADVSKVVSEADELNNAADSQPLTVNLPDLAFGTATFPASAAQGDTVNMSITILNQGAGDAPASNVDVVLTRDGSVCTPVRWCDESDDDWWLGYAIPVPTIAAGAQVTLSVPVTIPADFDPVLWPVIGLLDNYGKARETNESNNRITLGSISVLPSASTVIVVVDIKPGSYPNSINLGSNGVVPVAIMSTPTFDATTVDPLTVTLASSPIVLRGNGTPSASAQDVNEDGLMDLVVQVATEALQLTTTSTSAVLQGRTYAGQAFAGNDAVNVVP